jgi:hypothetical protein
MFSIFIRIHIGRISTVPTLARVKTSALGVQRSAFSVCGIPKRWCSTALHHKNRTIISASKGNPASEVVPVFKTSKNTEHRATERRTPNAERRTLNAERWTLNAERRTPNAERRTPNAERRTPNAERWTPNAERWTLNAERWTLNAERWTPNDLSFSADVCMLPRPQRTVKYERRF